MSNPFFDHPILNSPYVRPLRHWELDADGQPTQKVVETRRRAEFITPIPKPKTRKGSPDQQKMVFDEGRGLSNAKQEYDPNSIINELRQRVDQWRALPNPAQWLVTPETVRLLQHWRYHKFGNARPFFCQVEAAETVIWLTEVAPQSKSDKRFLDHLVNANRDANPELLRLALKLATGAGKTTVMAMLIAWQTINSVRRSQSSRFSRGFLVVTPGLTIKDRLRVLQPNDPDNYYGSRELVPGDMLEDVSRAKIVITNYHAFKRRERIDISKGGRSLLQGRGDDLNTEETEGQMLLDTTSGHVSISTMHLAKGLEFRAVAVMACDDEIIPLQERIETVGDDADLQDVYDTERHLLYVACTRARDHLLVTGVEPASEFLDDLRAG